jgi:hypothetical protein
MSYEAELAKLGTNYTIEDAQPYGMVEAFVSSHSGEVRMVSLDSLGIGDSPGEFPHLRAIRIVDGDTDDFYAKNGGHKNLWLLELFPVDGDQILIESGPQADHYGSEEQVQYLITSRKVLRESDDFEFIREFDNDDLIDADEEGYDPEEDGGYLSYGDDEEFDEE